MTLEALCSKHLHRWVCMPGIGKMVLVIAGITSAFGEVALKSHRTLETTLYRESIDVIPSIL